MIKHVFLTIVLALACTAVLSAQLVDQQIHCNSSGSHGSNNSNPHQQTDNQQDGTTDASCHGEAGDTGSCSNEATDGESTYTATATCGNTDFRNNGNGTDFCGAELDCGSGELSCGGPDQYVNWSESMAGIRFGEDGSGGQAMEYSFAICKGTMKSNGNPVEASIRCP